MDLHLPPDQSGGAAVGAAHVEWGWAGWAAGWGWGGRRVPLGKLRAGSAFAERLRPPPAEMHTQASGHRPARCKVSTTSSWATSLSSSLGSLCICHQDCACLPLRPP